MPTALRLTAASAQQTEFVRGEHFSSDGLCLETVYGGGGTAATDLSEVTVNADAFQWMTCGSYTIRVFLTENPDVYVEYAVRVDENPVVGTYYQSYREEGYPSYDILSLEIDRDFAIRMYDEYGVLGDTPVDHGTHVARTSDGKLLCYLSETADPFVYDPETHTFYNPGDTDMVFYQLTDADVRIDINQTIVPMPLFFVLPRGTAIPADYLAGYAAFGMDFYASYDDEAHTGTALDAATVYNSDATIYLRAPYVNYSGKPFVGEYYDNDGEVCLSLTADATLAFHGGNYPYTATETEDGWRISVSAMGGSFLFDSTAKTLTEESEEGPCDVYRLLDRETQVVVTFESTDDSEYSWLAGRYVCQKGEPAPLLLVRYSSVYRLILRDYDAAPLTDDATYVMTGAVEANLPNHVQYGTFACNFTFGDTYTVTRSVQGASERGSYTVVSLDEAGLLTLSLQIGSEELTAVLTAESYYSEMQIGGVTYANDPAFYTGAPFVSEQMQYLYSADRVIGLYIDSYGNGILRPDTETGDRYFYIDEVTVEGSVYTILFHYQEDEESKLTILYDADTHEFTYDGTAYAALSFIHFTYYCEGNQLYIEWNEWESYFIITDYTYQNGSNYTNTRLGAFDKTTTPGVWCMTFKPLKQSEEDGSLIPDDEATPIIISFSLANNTLTMDGKTYSYLERSELADTSLYFFKNFVFGEEKWLRITDVGLIEIGDTGHTGCLGRITGMTGAEVTYEYYGEGDAPAILLGRETDADGNRLLTITVGSDKYTYTMQVLEGYVFSGRYFVSEADSRTIRFDDSYVELYINDPSEGYTSQTFYVDALTEEGGVYTITTYFIDSIDEKTGEPIRTDGPTFVYDSATDCVTADGIVYQPSR